MVKGNNWPVPRTSACTIRHVVSKVPRKKSSFQNFMPFCWLLLSCNVNMSHYGQYD